MLVSQFVCSNKYLPTNRPEIQDDFYRVVIGMIRIDVFDFIVCWRFERSSKKIGGWRSCKWVCETIGARFEVVRGLLAKGEALIASDNPAAAATVLTKAQAMAQEHQLEREESIAQMLMARLQA